MELFYAASDLGVPLIYENSNAFSILWKLTKFADNLGEN